MRLFAAVDLPADQATALATAVDFSDARLRWVPQHQWHLTLAFYGEVDGPAVVELSKRLARAATRTPALSLRLAGAGTFPRRPRRANALWVGVAGDVDILARLAERCVAAGRRCGLTMEDRAFRPHLTVARARRPPADLRDNVAALSPYTGPPWRVTGFRLVHSTLGAQVRHDTLASWVLGTDPG